LSRDEVRVWAEQVREQARRIGVEVEVGLNNSELLDHPQWREILADLSGENLGRGLATNGRQIARDPRVLAELRERGVEWLQLTLGGGSPDTHDWFTRRPGSFDDICRAAALAEESGMHVAWVCVAYRPLAELVRMSQVATAISGHYQRDRYAHKGGIDQTIFLVKPQGKGAHLEARRPARSDLADLPAHLQADRFSQSYGAGCETEGELVEALCTGDRQVGCLESDLTGGCSHYVICRNGDVYPYCHERHPDFLLGNLTEDGGMERVREAALGDMPPRALAIRRRGLTELAAVYGDRTSELLHSGCSLCRTLVTRALRKERRDD
jgi:MoaA/NifB/PqqE/SkfB family radical SAM enzyme